MAYLHPETRRQPKLNLVTDLPEFAHLRISADYRPTTSGERLGQWIFVLLFCGILLAGLIENYTPKMLSVGFFIVFWVVMLVWHELGHALMARFLGWHVGEISIGFGPLLWEGNVGRTRVIVRLVPIEGYVLPAPDSARGARVKSALIYAAGPGSELLLLAVLVAFLGFDTVFNDANTPALIGLKTLAIVIIWGAGLNLIPFSIGAGVSDGLGILLAPFLTRDAIEQRMLTLDQIEMDRLANGGEIDAALQKLETMKQRTKQVDDLQRREIALLTDANRYDDARRKLDRLLDGRAVVELDDVALLHLEAVVQSIAPQERALNVDMAINRALRLAPQSPSLHITRGVLTVKQARYEVGGNELASAYLRATTSRDRARALGYLAIAAHHVGARDAERRFASAFEHINESVFLRDTVRKAMSAPTNDRSPPPP